MIPTRFRAAGGHGGYDPIIKDPAIERWNNMREDLYKGYTFNKKNVRIAVKYCVIFPVLMYAALSWDKAQVWDIKGTLRDVPLATKARKAEDLDELRSFEDFKQYDLKQ